MIAQQGEKTVEFRAAQIKEIPRATSLLNVSPRKNSSFFVAATPRPVERIVAAAAWIDSAGAEGEAIDARFDWTVIPGWREGRFPQRFLHEFSQDVREHGRRSLRTMRLVDPRSWETEVFRGAGFQSIARHEHFQIDGDVCRSRQDRISEHLYREPTLTAGRAIESIKTANAGAAAAIIGRHGLLALENFWSGFRQGMWQEFSAVLMHKGVAEGVLLASSKDLATVCIHVLAAESNKETFSGLVCFLLFQSLRRNCDAAGLSTVQFWAEPDRSPATRSLAGRFGAQLVGETVQYGLCL